MAALRSTLLAGLLAVAAACGPGPAPSLWAGLASGGRAVGFVTTRLEDPSRMLDGRPRVVQVVCWHAARARADASPLTYRDYFALSASERGPAEGAAVEQAIAAYRSLFKENGVDPALVDRWFAAPVAARRDQVADVSGAPLVVIAQGNGQSIHHQAILAEYLASYGYLVCGTPSQSRISGPMATERDVLPHARDQKADLQMAIRYARETFQAAASRPIGLVGHSFGARSALILAQAAGASALVSLDGGIGTGQARGWSDAAPELDPGTFNTPLLHLYETTEPQMAPDFELLRRLRKSARLLGRVDGLRHTDFTSLGFASAAFPGLTGPAPDALGDKCAGVALYTRMFLDAHLRGTQEATSFLAQSPRDKWLSLERLPPD